MRRVTARDLKQRRVEAIERELKCAAVRGAHDQRNRAFERRVGACAVSDNVEAFTIV